MPVRPGPVPLNSNRSDTDLIRDAIACFRAFPKTVIAADGDRILVQNPQGGSLDDRAVHLITNDFRRSVVRAKFANLARTVYTLENADIRLADIKNGTRIYACRYGQADNDIQLVVVQPKVAIENEVKVAGYLITQFPYAHGRQTYMRVGWSR